MNHIKTIAQELGLNEKAVEAAVNLIDEGNTIPFIARYRKEMTDSLDDAALRELSDRLEYLRNLEKRREEVAGLIAAADCMTEEISAALGNAATLSEIDDIYRPFRPKRKTRASVAKQKGLEPLAAEILAQKRDRRPLETLAAAYVDPEKGVETA